MSYLCQKYQKNWGHRLRFRDIMRVVNYPDFEKLAHVIEHGLQRFIVKNIEGESTEANDLYQKKNRGHRTSKIFKSRQSHNNGHLPYHLRILLLSAHRGMTWRMNLPTQ